MVPKTIKCRRRIFVAIDKGDARKGDVAQVIDFTGGLRTLFILAKRGGKRAGLKVQRWNMAPKWFPMTQVQSVYRWHKEVAS